VKSFETLLCVPPVSTLVSNSAYFSTVETEATCSFEMSEAFQRIVQVFYIPKYSCLQFPPYCALAF
jgi:hypothetical protein